MCVPGQCDSTSVLEFIRQYVPSARLTEEIGSEITFVLPASQQQLATFPTLFDELDSQKDELHIHKYGISDSTLEEASQVFIIN